MFRCTSSDYYESSPVRKGSVLAHRHEGGGSMKIVSNWFLNSQLLLNLSFRMRVRWGCNVLGSLGLPC